MDTSGVPTSSDGSFLCARGGRYTPLGLLARGSYGTCVLVRMAPEATPSYSSSCGSSPFRVVKTVDLLRATDDDTATKRSEALREAEVLKSLRHPNIIGYDDAFLADSHLCIVMEYADGGDLAGAISRRREAARQYHEREAMAIFAQLALALRHVHDRRILHRDVKSQNVFLTSSGVVKLGDFGVAKVLTASEVCAATRIGTPQCVPPELCENHPYDFKADVWGLGVILYQLFALECPFNGASIAALAVRICTAQPRPVPTVYSSEARVLVSRLLAKRAEDRPSSVEILAMSHVRRSVAALPARYLSHQCQSARASSKHRRATPALFCNAQSIAAEAAERKAESARIIRRGAANALRRYNTVPDSSSPEKRALRRYASVPECSSPKVSQRSSRERASPKKAKCTSPRKRCSSPRKVHEAASPRKACQFLLADENDPTSPGSRDLSILLESILDSPTRACDSNEGPVKSARSEGADTTSTRAATCEEPYSSRSLAGGSDRGGEASFMQQVAEELTSCTALLSALELEFAHA